MRPSAPLFEMYVPIVTLAWRAWLGSLPTGFGFIGFPGIKLSALFPPGEPQLRSAAIANLYGVEPRALDHLGPLDKAWTARCNRDLSSVVREPFKSASRRSVWRDI